jgi:hypothetical protein
LFFLKAICLKPKKFTHRRPKKEKRKKGTSRKGNYRTKYRDAVFLEAL